MLKQLILLTILGGICWLGYQEYQNRDRLGMTQEQCLSYCRALDEKFYQFSRDKSIKSILKLKANSMRRTLRPILKETSRLDQDTYSKLKRLAADINDFEEKARRQRLALEEEKRRKKAAYEEEKRRKKAAYEDQKSKKAYCRIQDSRLSSFCINASLSCPLTARARAMRRELRPFLKSKRPVNDGTYKALQELLTAIDQYEARQQQLERQRVERRRSSSSSRRSSSCDNCGY